MTQLGQVVGRGFFGLTLVCFAVSALIPHAVWAGATPMVAITRPDNGAVVGAEVWVDAVYQSVSGRPIVRLELLVDDQVVRSYTLPTAKTQGEISFSYTFQSPAGEAHRLSVRALDSAGAMGVATITVSVRKILAPPGRDEMPPVVNIYYPRPGERVSGTVEVKVDARDNVGVEWVFFYLDGRIKAMIKGAPPYIDRWDTTKVTDGEHVLQARAWDAAENEGRSAEVRVIVANREATTLQAKEPPPAATVPPAAAVGSPMPASPAVEGPVTAAAAPAAPVGRADDSFVIPKPAPVAETGHEVAGPPRAGEAGRAEQAPRLAAAARPRAGAAGSSPATALPQRPASAAPRCAQSAALLAAAPTVPVAGGKVAVSGPARAVGPARPVAQAPTRVAAAPTATSVALAGAVTAVAPVGARAGTSALGVTTRTAPSARRDTPASSFVGGAAAVAATPGAMTHLVAPKPTSAASCLRPCKSAEAVPAGAASKPAVAVARPVVERSGAVPPGETALAQRAPEVYVMAALPRASYRAPGEVRGTTPGPRPEAEGRVTVLPLALSRFRDVQVLFDGKLVPLRACPEVVKGIPMGPLREIFAQTDGVLYWFPTDRRVRGVSPTVTLDLRVGQREAKVNGEAWRLDLAPYIKQGRTMVPLSFLADVLGLTITFDSERGQLIVKTGAL